MKDYFRYFFLSNFPLDAPLNGVLPPVILPLLDLFLNKSDVHQSYRLAIREQLLSSSKEDPRSSALFDLVLAGLRELKETRSLD